MNFARSRRLIDNVTLTVALIGAVGMIVNTEKSNDEWGRIEDLDLF